MCEDQHLIIYLAKLFTDISFYNRFGSNLSKNLNASIELKRNKKGKGKLMIPFNNDEDFERIIGILNN